MCGWDVRHFKSDHGPTASPAPILISNRVGPISIFGIAGARRCAGAATDRRTGMGHGVRAQHSRGVCRGSRALSADRTYREHLAHVQH